MPRNVVLATTHRCEGCRLTLRWCVCPAFQPVHTPLAVDVLIHYREFMRPSSTGRLITRLMPGARHHLFRRETPPTREAVVRPGRTLWMLHPRGEPLPASVDPASIQVMLLDASWPEAARMAQDVGAWGRVVRLPAVGASRFRLREQSRPGNYSTIEALLFLLLALGLTEAEAALRLQFELHVYAGLRARGSKATALEFLAASPIREAFPELLHAFEQRRPEPQSIRTPTGATQPERQ